jgi:hypothetical protein
MRMRKLGHGQSVIFAAPPEIDDQIRKSAPKTLHPEANVDALDVLRWAMLETCKDLRHHVSHWAQQGIEYNRRAESQRQYEATRDVSILEKGWTMPEARKLEEMYGVLPSHTASEHSSFTQQALAVPTLRGRLEMLGIQELDDPNMDEEQEREVSHEIEREQQVERPPKRIPAAHAIHQDVRHFIQTGTIPTQLSGIILLFHPFSSFDPQTSKAWSQKLFASTDFLQTIAHAPTDRLSDYMRPVNWIVRGTGGARLVLSPHEVNELLPLIRQSSTVQLHVYAPRVTHSMVSFSDLRFYSVPARTNLQRTAMPSRTQLQLDLFAGQLYLSNYEEYMLLCTILGVYTLSNKLDIQVESDGFVKPAHRGQLLEHYPGYAECKFASSPIPMLKDLIGRRRKGMQYSRTHVGKILHGRTLTRTDF